MEPIKVEIGVTLDFSESVKQFFGSIFAPKCNCGCDKPAPENDSKPEAPKPTPAAVPETPKPAAPTAPKPATPVNPAPTQKINNKVGPSEDTVTVEMVRLELSKKVNDHRETIKGKLNELGAPSVTKLDPSKYEEMFNFLKSL